MEHLDRAYDILEEHLEHAVQKSDVNNIIMLTKGMKNILTVEAMCEEGHSGDDRSYAQRRNSRGQYSRDGRYDNRGHLIGNSRDDGRDQLMHKIDELKNAVDHMK